MKPDVIFALEGAMWPALLVAGNGVVLMSNQAAHDVFTTSLEGDPVQFAAIWAPENGNSAAVFMTQWETTRLPLLDLKFRGPTGSEKIYSTAVSLLESGGNKWFVFQLLSVVKPALKRMTESGTEFHAAPIDSAALKQRLAALLQEP